jgi:hypothetical protein
MNYRIIVLSCLFLNSFLVAKKIEYREQGTSKHEIESIIACASEFENFNPQAPKEALKNFEQKYKSRFEQKLPRVRALHAVAILKKAAQEDPKLSASERCEKTRIAQFLEVFASDKSKGWREKHPNLNSSFSALAGGISVAAFNIFFLRQRK